MTQRNYVRVLNRQRDIVNRGIHIRHTINTVAAVEYLKAHAIPASVIERVLLDHPSNRGQQANRSDFDLNGLPA